MARMPRRGIRPLNARAIPWSRVTRSRDALTHRLPRGPARSKPPYSAKFRPKYGHVGRRRRFRHRPEFTERLPRAARSPGDRRPGPGSSSAGDIARKGPSSMEEVVLRWSTDCAVGRALDSKVNGPALPVKQPKRDSPVDGRSGASQKRSASSIMGRRAARGRARGAPARLFTWRQGTGTAPRRNRPRRHLDLGGVVLRGPATTPAHGNGRTANSTRPPSLALARRDASTRSRPCARAPGPPRLARALVPQGRSDAERAALC
jgi:hypothetical protein